MRENPYKPGYKKEEKPKLKGKDLNFISAGLNILVCFVLCGGGGYFIDKHYGTDKWTTVGVFVGLIVGFYHFIKFIIDAMRNK